MRVIRRSLLTGFAAFAALVAGLTLATPSALAVVNYGLTASFGAEGIGAGQFKEPAGIAVDQTDHDVYVVDQGNNRVQKFNAMGNPEDFSALGTNLLSGIPAEAFLLAGFVGGALSDLDSGNGIAVDNSCFYHEPLTETECERLYPSNGDIYVVDTGHNVIDKFDEAGDYRGQLTGTCPSAGACSGAEVVPFSGLQGVAVNPEGGLWVYSQLSGEGSVAKFNGASSNEFVSRWGTGHETSPGFAVDSASNIYALRGTPNAEEFGALGEPLVEELTSCNCGSGGLAVDGFDDLYIDEGQSVAEYGAPVGPLSQPIHEFGSEHLAKASGIAVSAGGTVYVADSVENMLDIFELGEPPGPPITEEATSVKATSATLNGTLASGSKEVGYYFSYNEGSSCTGPGAITTTPGKAASGGKVSTSLTGLTPATLPTGRPYTFCLIATNSFGHTFGEGESEHKSFATPPIIENLSKCTTSLVTGETAILHASLEGPAKYYFQFGQSLLYGSETKVLEVGLGSQTVESTLEGLEPHRVYDCRLVAATSEGTSYGENGTFETAAPPPEVIDEWFSSIGPRLVRLNATIDPEGSVTTYYIQYVEASHYHPAPGNSAAGYEEGKSTPIGESVGSNSSYDAVQQTVDGLEPGTSYDYRVVTTNSVESEPGVGGTSYGPTGQFTTARENPPAVSTGAVSGLTATGVTLSGTVNPEGYATSYVFEIAAREEASHDEAYETEISGVTESAAGARPQDVTLTLEHLTPLTMYFYRVSATNRNGINHGEVRVFTTPGASYSLVLPVVPPMLATPPFSFPGSEEKPVFKPTKFEKALKACRKEPRGKRVSCENKARRRYRSFAGRKGKKRRTK